MTEQNNTPDPSEPQPQEERDGSGVPQLKSTQVASELRPASPKPRTAWRKWGVLLCVIGIPFLAAMGVFGAPWLKKTLNTVSTDDAFVSGHVTFVASRVPGQVSRVFMDDNNRVRK